MKKLTISALSAAVVFAAAGSMTMTAQAATATYQLPGNSGKAIVIGGGNGTDLQNILNQINGNVNINDLLDSCTQNLPNWNLPNGNVPDNSLPGPDNGGSSQGQTGSQSRFADQVVRLVNAERAKAGLSSLSVDSRVVDAAQTRAREIETSFSHTRPDGSSFSSVLNASGVSFRGAGENIAYGQSTPEEVMKGWMNSEGHRANIMNPNFTSIGVGHYQSASGVQYWTQLFIN